MRKHKEPACTFLVMECLKAADDFMTVPMIAQVTGCPTARIVSALWTLRTYYSAVQCMEVQGTVWWFATAEDDKRTKIVKERAPEVKPRRPHKRKKVP